MVEGHIRPGCVYLTVQMLVTQQVCACLSLGEGA